MDFLRRDPVMSARDKEKEKRQRGEEGVEEGGETRRHEGSPPSSVKSSAGKYLPPPLENLSLCNGDTMIPPSSSL